MMTRIRIEAAENGYIVCYDDPEIEARNMNSDDRPYQDPEKQVLAADGESVAKILAKVLPTLKPIDPSDEYATAFKEASST